MAVRPFPDQTVLLNLATGEYHGLDPVGSRFLEALRSSGDVQGALAALAPAYDVDSRRLAEDMREFCVRLADRGLIELHRDDAG